MLGNNQKNHIIRDLPPTHFAKLNWQSNQSILPTSIFNIQDDYTKSQIKPGFSIFCSLTNYFLSIGIFFNLNGNFTEGQPTLGWHWNVDKADELFIDKCEPLEPLVEPTSPAENWN